ncbi:MAG TPA: DUF6644 family protein [Planctomycetaceae bacterium]|nr:DUF6644 family protein [Planctomycetaceae bacterium]
MILAPLWQALENSSLAQFVASSTWAFPTIETLHVISFVIVLGTIVVMDIRMLGLTATDYPLTRLSKDTLRITWIGFVCAAITGSLLFISKATDYAINPYFQRKMICMALAGANMVVFEFLTWRSVKNWDVGGAIPTATKIAAALSLIFWVLVVFFGRTVGFTLGVFY